jgi:tetratricopeptide (TPR) repeat protein
VGRKADTSEFDDPAILIRGLSSNAFDDNDVVKKKVIPVYVTMATSAGMYFASQGRHEKAIEKFKQALAIDATFEPAKKLWVRRQNALQE